MTDGIHPQNLSESCEKPESWQEKPMPYFSDPGAHTVRRAYSAAWRDMALKGIERLKAGEARRKELIGTERPCLAGWACQYFHLSEVGAFHFPQGEGPDEGWFHCPESEEADCYKKMDALRERAEPKLPEVPSSRKRR